MDLKSFSIDSSFKHAHCNYVINENGFIFENISHFTFLSFPKYGLLYRAPNDTFVCCSCGIVLNSYKNAVNHYIETVSRSLKLT